MTEKVCQNANGQVPKDQMYTDVVIQSALQACTSNVQIATQNNVVILDEIPTATAVYNITPFSSKTIFTFREPLQHNTSLSFVVDNSQSRVGDQMIWLLANGQEQKVNITGLGEPDFYFRSCDNIVDSYELLARNDVTYGIYRFAQYWAFDGTTWIYTSEEG